MASRKVILLTKGYFRGLLDFKYPQYYSTLREAVILDQLEREEISQVIATRLQVDAAILSANPSQEAVKKCSETLDKFLEMKLPYARESSKINSTTGPLSEEERQYYINLFAERKKLNDSISKSEKS